MAVIVAEVATGKNVLRLETGPVNLLAFSHDGRILATSDRNDVRLWETATGKEILRRSRHGALPGAPAQATVWSIAFMSGDRALATGLGDGTILIWDLTPWEQLPKKLPRDLHQKALTTLWSDI